MYELADFHTRPSDAHEGLGEKLQREGQLLKSGVDSFFTTASDAFSANHLAETGGQALLSGTTSLALAKLAPAKSPLGLVAKAALVGMSVAFTWDVARNGGEVGGAMLDTLNSDRNWDKNVATIQNSLGKFAFHTVLNAAVSTGASELGNHIFGPPKKSIGLVAESHEKIDVAESSIIGKSPWLERTPVEKRYPTLVGEHKVDVAIVGGGVAGNMLANTLAQQGARVALIERGRIAGSQTAQMGGIVTRAFDAYYSDMIKEFGPESMKNLSRLSRDGLAEVQSFAGRVNSNYRDDKSYFLSYRPGDPLLAKEWNVIKDIDPDARFVQGKEASQIFAPMKEAIVFDKEGMMEIRPFVLGLAENAHQHGAKIFEDSPVNSIKVGEKVELKTDRGTVIADKMIHAAGWPVPVGKWQGDVHQKRVFALTADLPPGSKIPSGNLFDTEQPLNFYRMLGQREMLLGGQDANLGASAADKQAAEQRLEAFLQRLFPGSEVTRRWSGVINETHDGMPYIGEHPEFKGKVFVSTGYGGTGLVWSGVSSLILPRMLNGKPNPNPELFAPARTHS